MDWYIYPAIILVGIFAGFINTLAGSGSLLTLPLLMFLGLPANVANGTNRVAILLQNVVGVSSFKQQKVLSLKEGLRPGIAAVAGALLGAVLAVNIDRDTMELFIGGLLVFMFFFIILKPGRWIRDDDADLPGMHPLLQLPVFFLVGLYGGFIQAGVGFFLLAALVMGGGFGLVKANALKVLIILIYTPIALAVFVWHGQVDWSIGLILAVGNMIGAFIGSRLAVSWGPKFVRIILLVAILGSSLKLFGVFEYIF